VLATQAGGTLAGVVLETVGYIAPEQVRGQTADRRSDIFRLSAVPYEMLAGARTFKGATSADPITAILASDLADLTAVARIAEGAHAGEISHELRCRHSPRPVRSNCAARRGGTGEVYTAPVPKLNRDVAIKILLPAVANDPDRLARFQHEAHVLASLNHPNIAQIYGLEDSNDIRALVMEVGRAADGRGLYRTRPGTVERGVRLSANSSTRWKRHTIRKSSTAI